MAPPPSVINTSEQVDTSTSPGSEEAKRLRRKTVPLRVTRAAVWLLPIGLFSKLYGLKLLVVTRAAPLLWDDWVTYIASPNFLRGAPVASFPIGRVPGYMSPIGSWVGQTDSSPILVPVYRIAVKLFPDRPVQFVGWVLFIGMMATFGVTLRVLRNSTRGARTQPTATAEIALAFGALALCAQPFVLLRFVHPTLFQPWVIVWALWMSMSSLAREDGEGIGTHSRLAFLAPIAVAAVLEPYLAVMVTPIMFAPSLFRLSSTWRETLVRAVWSAATVIGISLTLGYIGTSGRNSAGGFGSYSADLAFLVDSNDRSKVVPDIESFMTFEGNGFVGIGALTVIVIAIMWYAFFSLSGAARPIPPFRLLPLTAVVLTLAVYAFLPDLRLFGWHLVGGETVTEILGPVAQVIRANGRFVWPASWLVCLVAFGFVLRHASESAAVIIFAGAAVLQVADVKNVEIPEVVDTYAQTAAPILEARSNGVRRIDIEPPWITGECQPDVWVDFDRLGEVIVAAAVLRVPVNAGYPSRGSEELFSEICVGDANDYDTGRFMDDVLYIVPLTLPPTDPSMRCQQLPRDILACRYEP